MFKKYLFIFYNLIFNNYLYQSLNINKVIKSIVKNINPKPNRTFSLINYTLLPEKLNKIMVYSDYLQYDIFYSDLIYNNLFQLISENKQWNLESFYNNKKVFFKNYEDLEENSFNFNNLIINNKERIDMSIDMISFGSKTKSNINLMYLIKDNIILKDYGILKIFFINKNSFPFPGSILVNYSKDQNFFSHIVEAFKGKNLYDNIFDNYIKYYNNNQFYLLVKNKRDNVKPKVASYQGLIFNLNRILAIKKNNFFNTIIFSCLVNNYNDQSNQSKMFLSSGISFVKQNFYSIENSIIKKRNPIIQLKINIFLTQIENNKYYIFFPSIQKSSYINSTKYQNNYFLGLMINCFTIIKINKYLSIPNLSDIDILNVLINQIFNLLFIYQINFNKLGLMFIYQTNSNDLTIKLVYHSNRTLVNYNNLTDIFSEYVVNNNNNMKQYISYIS